MIHVIEQSREQKLAMYMKLTKRELAEMLFNVNQVLIIAQYPLVTVSPSPHRVDVTTNPPMTTCVRWSPHGSGP